MIVFRTPSCLSKLSPSHSSYQLVKSLIDRQVKEFARANQEWLPEYDGFFILVETDDMNLVLEEIHPGRTLATIPWQGFEKRADHYIGVSLISNQAAISWIIHASNLPSRIRKVFDDNLIPTPDNSSN